MSAAQKFTPARDAGRHRRQDIGIRSQLDTMSQASPMELFAPGWTWQRQAERPTAAATRAYQAADTTTDHLGIQAATCNAMPSKRGTGRVSDTRTLVT